MGFSQSQVQGCCGSGPLLPEHPCPSHPSPPAPVQYDRETCEGWPLVGLVLTPPPQGW